MSSTPVQITKKVANYVGQFSNFIVFVCRQPGQQQDATKETFRYGLALAQRHFALKGSSSLTNQQSLYEYAYIFEVIPSQEPAAVPHWIFQNYMTATSPRSLIKLGRLQENNIDADAIRQTCTNIPVPHFGTTQDSKSWTIQVVSALRDQGLVHFQRLDKSRQVEQIDTRTLFADLTYWARTRISIPEMALKSNYAPLGTRFSRSEGIATTVRTNRPALAK